MKGQGCMLTFQTPSVQFLNLNIYGDGLQVIKKLLKSIFFCHDPYYNCSWFEFKKSYNEECICTKICTCSVQLKPESTQAPTSIDIMSSGHQF